MSASLDALHRLRQAAAEVGIVPDGTIPHRQDVSREDATVAGNVKLVSGRGDGSQGALITTEDHGRGSPPMSNALFTLEDGGRITGVTMFHILRDQLPTSPSLRSVLPDGVANRSVKSRSKLN